MSSSSRAFHVLTVLLVSSMAGAAAATDDEQNTIAVFRDASRGVVHIEARDATGAGAGARTIEGGTGSGFLVDAQGRIFTNAHVISGKTEIDVIADGRRLPARLIGTAPQLDLALLQVDVPAGERLHPLPLGDSRALQVGQKVLAIGNPFGLHNTLTVGVVSALNRTVAGTPLELREALIQTDAAINPGNSGGPLLDSAGRVVGVNALGSDAQSLAFAIPIHLALRVMQDLVDMGHAYRPRLGFDGLELTPAIARLFGLSRDRGYLIEEVLPRSPAERAGLRAGGRLVVTGDRVYVLGGDVITAINGQAVLATSDLARLLLEARPGDLLRIEVDRDGVTREVVIALEQMHAF